MAHTCAVLLNETVGVPLRFSCPPLLSGSERDVCYKTYAVASSVPVECVDRIVTLVRNLPTTEAYDTHGGVVDEALIDLRVSWSINRGYRRLLLKALRPFTIEDAILIDQSFRVKRCRGNTCVRDAYGTMRCLVWYQTNTQHRGSRHAGAWFDITLSVEPVRLPFEAKADTEQKRILASSILRRTCGGCGAGDNPTQGNTFKACSRCKTTYYCSVTCQRAAWKVHKRVCSPPP